MRHGLHGRECVGLQRMNKPTEHAHVHGRGRDHDDHDVQQSSTPEHLSPLEPGTLPLPPGLELEVCILKRDYGGGDDHGGGGGCHRNARVHDNG